MTVESRDVVWPRRLLVILLAIDAVLLTAAAVVGEVVVGDSARLYDERKPVTWLSAAYLLGTAWLAYRVFVQRRGDQVSWRAPAVIWLAMSLGFAFLAVDDLFRIHEQLDELVHDLFSLRETDLTDRIDDALIALYGLVGFAALVVCRREIGAARPAFPFGFAGFLVLVLMIVIEATLNQMESLGAWVDVLADGAKVVAETLFFVGFLVAADHLGAVVRPRRGQPV